MPLGTDFVQVPHGMVEHDQNAWQAMQLGEDLIEMRSGWRSSKLCESAHPGRAGRAGQVVYAEMKHRVHIGYGPLDGDWGVGGAGRRAQQKWAPQCHRDR